MPTTTTRGSKAGTKARGGLAADATPDQIKAHIERRRKEREDHLKAADDVNAELVALYESLKETLAEVGMLPDAPKRRGGGKGTVREDAGTGKILAIIKDLAVGDPPVVKTSDVTKIIRRKFPQIKSPHSSFQSLQSAGAIKLGTPERGHITLLK